MRTLENTQQYLEYWKKEAQPFLNKYTSIDKYSKKLESEINVLINDISPETFWDSLPIILGIDAKLALLSELFDLINVVDLDPDELVAWVEKDYLSYNKELCGYSINSKTNCSLIFNVQ